MLADLSGLSKKLNLYSDESYEDFRDVLTDNAVNDQYTPLEAGEVKWFGNDCRLESVSNTPVDVSQDHDFLSDVMGPGGEELDSLSLSHSKLLLHMQAEENIKIDIIWELTEPHTPGDPKDYTPIAVYYEGTDSFNDEPSFDPMDSGYWDEFLHDMGIGSDPYADDDE